MKEIEVQSKSEEIVFSAKPENKKFQDLTGQKFGHLTVLGFAGRMTCIGKHLLWWLRCDCGDIRKTSAANFKYGRSFSCGCQKASSLSKAHTTHGMSTSTEFKSWSSLKRRCLNETSQDWGNYGGRGIKVCDRWIESFENFLEDMGRKPSPSHSIDRIDNNGNYEPSNCRWATTSQQIGNTRLSNIVEYNGKRQCVSEWEKELGFASQVLRHRLANGWSIERAFTQPVIKRRPKSPSQTPCTDQPASHPHQTCH